MGSTLPLLSGLVALLAAIAPAEEPAARFAGGSVSMAEFERYLATRYQKDSLGKDALEYLIRDRILEREVERRGIVISAEELAAALAVVEKQILEAERHTLAEELELKAMDRATFEAFYRKHLACERMVREDLQIQKHEPVRPEQQELWLADRVKQTKVDREGQPAGVLASIGGSPVTLEDLGRTLRLKLGRADVREALKAFVGMRLVATKAAEAGVELSAADIEAAITRRRERFVANNPIAGVSFEEFLKAKGVTLDDLRADGGVRGEAQLWKLGEKLYPDAEVDKQYEARKDYWDGLLGESRRVSWILLFAAHTPGFPVSKTFPEAEQELTGMMDRWKASPQPASEFARLASIYSNDGTSKKRNGEIGWLHRREPGYDAGLLGAVFATDAAPGRLVGPFRVEQGAGVALIHEVKPGPEPAALRPQIRSALVAELYQRMRDEAKITTYLDPKVPAGISPKSEGSRGATR
ncbi:MAG: peptidylprolyl isomerase [Planctomycetes bacterium]|nr:peptidylprolyl isomerase [Planctomycetota bacterium]